MHFKQKIKWLVLCILKTKNLPTPQDIQTTETKFWKSWNSMVKITYRERFFISEMGHILIIFSSSEKRTVTYSIEIYVRH